MIKNKYTIVYRFDKDGCWFVSVPEVEGCYTQARSLTEAIERIREALSLFDSGFSEEELTEVFE